LKRTLNVFLSAVLLVTLLAASAPALAETADPLEPYDETVTIQIMREKENIWFPEGESIYDNVITQFMEETLNIEFDVQWAVESGSYTEQINLAIASNSLPDIFEVNESQLYQVIRNDMVQSLQDAWDEYASDEVKEILSYNNNLFFSKCTQDGEIYAFPRTDDFASAMPIMFIRQDWLDAVDLGAPTDLESFLEVCEAFTNGDPDGNGKDDTFALAFDSTGTYSVYTTALSHMLGFPVNTWLEGDDGTLYFTDIQPEVKELLELMQDMYSNGYISQEYISTNTDRMSYLVAAGKTGIVIGYFWTALYQPQMSMAADPDAEWMAYPIPSYPDGSYHIQADNSCYSWLVVSKDFEYPEALIKLQNLWYELWRGDYSDWYHGLNAGEYAQAQEDFKYYPPFWWDPPLKNFNIAANLREVYANGKTDLSPIADDPEAMKAYEVMEEYLGGDATQLYGWSHWLNNMYAWAAVADYYGGTDSSQYVISRYQGPITSTIARRLPLVNALRTELFDKIIMGADVDETFDTFVTQWHKIGGDIIAEEYNEWYAENKSVYWPE